MKDGSWAFRCIFLFLVIFSSLKVLRGARILAGKGFGANAARRAELRALTLRSYCHAAYAVTLRANAHTQS
jgi:hypothetical protein